MNLKETIHELLVKHIRLRDSDNKLTANVWNKELKLLGHNPKTMSAFELMKLFAEDKLSSPTSIRRHRAKFQELIPELRGAKYKARQVNAQNKWKQKLKDENLYKEINNNFEQTLKLL